MATDAKRKLSATATTAQIALRSPWTSIWVCALIACFQDLQFSIFFSTLFNYSQLTDSTVTETFYRYVKSWFVIDDR